jgi:ABC-type uncharacterized transport system substrate-binding protein
MRLIGLAVALALAVTFAPLAGEAQQADKVRRIGFLSGTSRSPAIAHDLDGLIQGLREHGYLLGQNLLIEWRFADGRTDQLPGFAAELVRLKVEVIVTVSTEAAFAAKKATASTPIVFTQVPDPVASGLVSSLAQPGGNLSGFSILSVELTGKRLELFKEAIPLLKAVIILSHRGSPASALGVKEAEAAASRLRLEARHVDVSDTDELERVFTTLPREPIPPGVVLVSSTFLVAHGSQVADLAIRRRLPLLAWTNTLARSGALMSYGPSTFDVLRRAGGTSQRF